MVTALSNDTDQRRRKQTLERAKANHLSRQLQMRLQYARLKVEHGWQRQNLNEVENLYFHHSAVGRTSTNSGNIVNNTNRTTASKVGHLAAPPVMTFQLDGTGVEGTATGEGTESGTATRDKEMPGVHDFSGGQETADAQQTERMDVGGDPANDESQLDPRILMESAGWGAVERRNSADLAQGVGLAQMQVPYAPSSVSTSPWLVGTPSAQFHPTQASTSSISPNTPSAPNQVAPHPYFSSYPQLPYPVHTQPHAQPQSQQQTSLRLSNVPPPEVSVPPTSLPDTPTPISQNPPRSRSGSASPWQKGNHINLNSTINPDANASASPAANNASTNNGFGSSALTYDSFWSGFRGSTTPTALASLPTSTSTPASTTSTPSMTGGRTRTRTTNPTNSTSTRTTITAPAAPVAVIPAHTPNINPFDMDMGMDLSMSMNMAMAMNMGMLGIGMGVVDDSAADGGGGGSYGLGR